VKIWTWPICQTRNPLPQTYHQITPDCKPAELYDDFTTVEYTLQTPHLFPPVFLFVVDTALSEKEFEFLKSVLLLAVSSLPPAAYVGFISFGSLISVHELKVNDFPRTYVFSGNKTYSAAELQKMLAIGDPASNPFVLLAEEAELMLTSLVDRLELDSCPVPKGERTPRCTGTALHLAVTLLEILFAKLGGQILLFTSGPITKGQGAMATLARSDPVRQHTDIDKNNVPLTTAALGFFSEVGARASDGGIVINYISAAFEETGLYELQPAILRTGGWIVSGESWREENISQTIQKYFAHVFPHVGCDCTISLNCTRNFKIAGCIGTCTSLGNKANPDLIAEKPIGNGGTTEWKFCGALPSTTLAFFIDISASKADPVPAGTTGYIQFVTRYRHVQSGKLRLRVTTHSVRFTDLVSGAHLIASSFDQQAATVLLARYAMWKVRDEDLLDVVHYIDRTLIRFCRKFGTYNKGDPQSFSLSGAFSMFPQFLYHMRRSPFMSTFNSSPDLTTSLRHTLLLEHVAHSLFMIQPSLIQYSLEGPPTPVLLDTNSLQRNCVLLLDTFFRVLVWHGSDVAAWRNARYHEQLEYESLKVTLEAPLAEAKALIEERFPTPLLVVCDQDSGLAKYLLARCNPSTQNYEGLAGKHEENLGTDEPSLASRRNSGKSQSTIKRQDEWPVRHPV
jgi:protein transport protein SEC23